MMGLNAEQWAAKRPALTRDNEVVLEVWRFCGGWQPGILPLAAVYHGAEDLDFLVSQLLTLRDLIEAHHAAQIEGG